jgi:nicotinamidase-related amidase
MKALILVDIQYDFCPGGSLAVPEGDPRSRILRIGKSPMLIAPPLRDRTGSKKNNTGTRALREGGRGAGVVVRQQETFLKKR